MDLDISKVNTDQPQASFFQPPVRDSSWQAYNQQVPDKTSL
jgi:hypothetical protein